MDVEDAVVVYSRPGCKVCNTAKRRLAELGVSRFSDVDVEAEPEKGDFMRQLTGKEKLPQIFVNDFHLGGWEELKKVGCRVRVPGICREE